MARNDSHEVLRRLDLNLLVVFDALIRFAKLRVLRDKALGLAGRLFFFLVRRSACAWRWV